jgi:hypothetical protein
MAQHMKQLGNCDAACSGQTRALVQGFLLPEINFLPSLPGIPQRFFSLHQSLQDFHQPLHGLIRGLKEFLQPLPKLLRHRADARGQRIGQWSDTVSTLGADEMNHLCSPIRLQIN